LIILKNSNVINIQGLTDVKDIDLKISPEIDLLTNVIKIDGSYTSNIGYKQ